MSDIRRRTRRVRGAQILCAVSTGPRSPVGCSALLDGVPFPPSGQTLSSGGLRPHSTVLCLLLRRFLSPPPPVQRPAATVLTGVLFGHGERRKPCEYCCPFIESVATARTLTGRPRGRPGRRVNSRRGTGLRLHIEFPQVLREFWTSAPWGLSYPSTRAGKREEFSCLYRLSSQRNSCIRNCPATSAPIGCRGCHNPRCKCASRYGVFWTPIC